MAPLQPSASFAQQLGEASGQRGARRGGWRRLSALASLVLVSAAGCGAGASSGPPPTAKPIATPSSGSSSAAEPGFVSGLVTDGNAVLGMPTASRPGYLATIQPAPFGTSISRLVGDPGGKFTILAGGGQGTWGTSARQHYSLDEPWNVAGTLIAIDNSGGSPKRVYLDGSTYAVRYGACPGTAGGDDRWNPIPAHGNERIEVLADNRTLEWVDVTTCAVTRSWTLPMPVIGIGHFKGNPSEDGRFLALGDETSMFVVDMLAWPAVRIGPIVNLRQGCNWSCVVRNITVSSSGRYVMVGYEGDARRVFDLDPSTLGVRPRPMPPSADWAGCQGTGARGFVHGTGHADVAIDPFDSGEDVIVGQDNVCSKRGGGGVLGSVLMVRMRDGAVTSLTGPTNEASAWFVSCRNTSRRGWCYATYRQESRAARFNGEVVAVKLDGSLSVERFGQTRTINGNSPYDDQPHSVPSRDGRRIIFASDWELACGTGCGGRTLAQAYLLDASDGSRG